MKFVSDIDSLERIQKDKRALFIQNVSKSANRDLYVVVLADTESETEYCVPMRINIGGVKVHKGDVIIPHFGDVFYDTGVSFVDEKGCSHELDIWEQPTRWLESDSAILKLGCAH